MRPMTIGIARAVDDLLQPLGFSRREGAWNRKRNGLIDVISMQMDKAGRRVTFEAGVLHPIAYSKVWETRVPDFVDAPECTIRARVGQLTDNHDRWWSLEEPGIASQIVDRTTSELLPFLDRNQSSAAIERSLAASGPVRYLRPPETVYLAFLLYERGDIGGACALLQRFSRKVLGDWKPSAERLMERLRCPST